uniref:Uncharacterized protein n=1 Tax=Tanacetum cinerariifolium TaxID=118510 RepID=A0A6L2KBQ6_TANCI|nr:hypothetical protein [Tanacetum cinerariifolium]
MVACLERTDGNAEFHQIVDFLTSSMIHYALTTHTPRRTKRGQDTEIPQSSGPPNKVDDEAIYTGEDDRVVRAATFTASLEAEQESGNIDKTQPTTTLNEPSPQETGSGSRPRRHVTTLGDTYAQTRFETASKKSHDSPLSGGHTPGSDKGRPNINELMNICNKLSNKVLALEQFKTAQDLVIKRLKKKVKRLEKKQKARTPGMKLFKIGTSKKKTLDKENVSKQERDESNIIEELNLFDKGSGGTEVFTAVEKDVNADEPVSTLGDAVNAASVILDVSATGPSTSVAGPSTSTAEDIFKDEMTTMADTLMAIRRTRPRTTSVVIHDVEEKPRRATLLPTVQSQDKERKRFFAGQRAKQIRNKPPTKTQLKNKMETYLKHMGKYTHNQLKSKSFEEIQMLYEREQKWINDFVPMDSEDVNDKEDDAKKEELKACLDIVTVDDVAINVESLASKYLIVDWKIHTLTEHMMYYQIIRANGSSKNYKILIEMCDDFDRQDIIDLYKLVKERYETTSPEGYDLLLWGDLITLFEPSKEDVILKA